MRFKCVLRDVNALLPTLQAFLYSGGICLLVLAPDKTRVIVPADHTSGEQLYAELDTNVWTEECKIESQQNNTIPFLVYLPNLLKALKACEKAERAVLKLTKRNQRAYLTCDTLSAEGRVQQDVPIIVQSTKRVDDWEEPMLEEPQVKLSLPDLKALAALIDKMKHVSDVIDIVATSDGKITLTAEQSMVKITSTYSDLKINQGGGGSGSERSVTPLNSHAESPAQNQVARALQEAQAQAAQQQQQQQPQQPQAGADGVVAMDLDGAAGAPAVGAVGPSVSLSALQSAVAGTPVPPSTPQGSAPPTPSSAGAPVVRASCRVSMKKFANVCGAKNIQTLHTIACIVEDAAFVVYLKLKNRRGIITYYLPLIQQ